MNICTPCSGDFACTDVYQIQNLQSMDYKYSFTDDTTCVLGPQKLQCSREYKNVSQHISNVHSCNQNNKFLVTNNKISAGLVQCSPDTSTFVLLIKPRENDWYMALKGLWSVLICLFTHFYLLRGYLQTILCIPTLLWISYTPRCRLRAGTGSQQLQ